MSVQSQVPVMPMTVGVEETIVSVESVQNIISEPEGSSTLIYLIVAFVVVTLFILWKNYKSKTVKRQIGLIGERGSGKTQLFISLCGGKAFETVPSIANNSCEKQLGSSKYKINDFMGDNLSKEEILSQLPRFHILVHVIDGCDSKKLGDAALFIYRVLINKQYQKDPCHFIVFLNKVDEKGFHGQQKLVKRIEDQIETIKISRRNQPEENQGEEDILRNERTRFDLKKQEMQIVVGSSRTDRKALESALEQLC